jgi:UDP-3-O-acyl N-acetylglucosamine deacetylase
MDRGTETAADTKPGKATNVRRLSYRYQRTLARSATVRGVGFLTGNAVRLHFRPAPPATGLVFIRTDLRPAVRIPAQLDQVTGTQRRTTIGRAPAQGTMVEHVLAALAGLRIDHCYIAIDSVEPPGLDGSARGYVDALLEAGALLQPARRGIWGVSSAVVVAANGATLALHPLAEDELRISYLLDYGAHTPIGRHAHTFRLTPETFANEIADCRTFLLEAEALEIRRQGFGLKTTAADLIVVGPHGPIGNRLRYANESARHKILDIVGDLALLGHDLWGHVVAYRSGHPLNVKLGQTLCEHMQLPVERARRCAA